MICETSTQPHLGRSEVLLNQIVSPPPLAEMGKKEDAQEVWLPYPENNLYEVSSLGRIRRDGKVLKPSLKSRYHYIILCGPDGQVSVGLHRIVCRTFHGPYKPGWEANHKNGKKLENSADNLEWQTRSGNQQHAYDTGLKPVGTKSHLWKGLKPEYVRTIRALAGQLSQQKIANKFGISQTYVGKIIHRTKWRQLT